MNAIWIEILEYLAFIVCSISIYHFKYFSPIKSVPELELWFAFKSKTNPDLSTLTLLVCKVRVVIQVPNNAL